MTTLWFNSPFKYNELAKLYIAATFEESNSKDLLKFSIAKSCSSFMLYALAKL